MNKSDASSFSIMAGFFPDTDSPTTNRKIPILDKVIQFSLVVFVVFSMFSISVTQIAFALGALSWILKVYLTQTWKELRGTKVGVAILCFCLAGILSIITSVDWESSIQLMKKLIQFVIFFWAANAIQNEKQRDLLTGLVIITGVATALNGLAPLSGDHYIHRIKGTMSKESTYAGILMLSGLVNLAILLFQKPKTYWALGGLGIITSALMFTLTRQAWLGFFVGTIFLLFVCNKKLLFLLPLLFLGLSLVAPTKVKNRILSFTNLQDDAFQQRASLWKSGWKIFKDHPITGCGYKCVDSVRSQYLDPSGLVERMRGVHSNLLQLLIDTGVVGLGLWVSIWAAYFFEIFRRFRALDVSQSNSRGILMGSAAAVLAYLVGGFFETTIYDSEIAMLLYFLMGLSLATVKKSPRVE